jgi:hypothetical protein
MARTASEPPDLDNTSVGKRQIQTKKFAVTDASYFSSGIFFPFFSVTGSMPRRQAQGTKGVVVCLELLIIHSFFAVFLLPFSRRKTPENRTASNIISIPFL